MLGVSFRETSGWPPSAAPYNEITRAGLVASLLGHVALVAIVIGAASTHAPASLIPIAIVMAGDIVAPELQLSFSDQDRGVPGLSLPLSDIHHARTLVVAKSDEAIPGVQSGPSSQASSTQGSRREQGIQPEAGVNQNGSDVGIETAGVGRDTVTFVDDKSTEPVTVEVTRRTDWQGNPIEDNTLTYSVPGSAVRLTLREASSGGFLGAHSAFTNGQSTEPPSLSQLAWDANATARSQKIEWTLIDTKSFGLTTFGYQSEVGYDFRPFDRTKKEFATPGANTIKTGGDVRLGAFSLGVAHSSITALEYMVPAFSETTTNAEATVNEGSLSLDLAQVMASEGGLNAKLIPTVWMTASDRQSAGYSTISTGFGGTWKWNRGHATLGYWNYYSDGDSAIESAWRGHGFDATLGAYYKAVAVDLSASYGQSEDLAPQWQSSGDIYSSSVSVSYTPEKVPGVWASATIGNYDRAELAYGNSSPNVYGVNSNGEYLSIAAGLDFTNWFWESEPSSVSQLRSVKLLYRYSDSLTVDGMSGRAGEQDSLVAMMVQRKF